MLPRQLERSAEEADDVPSLRVRRACIANQGVAECSGPAFFKSRRQLGDPRLRGVQCELEVRETRLECSETALSRIRGIESHLVVVDVTKSPRQCTESTR